MIGHVLGDWFAWPDGGVWSNLASSAITGVLTFAAVEWRARVHLDRLRAHLAQHHHAPGPQNGPEST